MTTKKEDKVGEWLKTKYKGISRVVTKDGKDRFNVKKQCGFLTSGKPNVFNKTFDTLKEAKEISDKWVAASKAKRGTITDITLDEFAADCLDKLEKSKKLLPQKVEQKRREYKKHISPCLGKMRIQEIEVIDIENLYISLQQDKRQRRSNGEVIKHTLSNSSILTMVTPLLNMIMNTAVRYKIRRDSPMIYAENPKRDDGHAREGYTNEEFNKLVFEAQRSYNPNPLKIFMIQGFTGLRISEALGLQWNCLDLDNNVLEVRQQAYQGVLTEKLKTKNSKRTVRIPVELKEFLVSIKKGTADIDFIIHPKGNPKSPLSYAAARETLATIGKRAGVGNTVTHALRKFALTSEIQNGATLLETSRAAGHTTTRITESIYIGHNNEISLRAGDRMTNILTFPPKYKGAQAI